MSTSLLAQNAAENVGKQVTETYTTSRDAVTGAFSSIYDQFSVWAPKALAAVVVLVVGYFVARIAAKLITAAAEKLGLQTAAERGGLVESMKHVGIRQSVPAIIGTIVFWFLMCVFFMSVFNTLGATELSVAMQGLVDYIPRVLGAVVIVVVGLLVGNLLRGIVATTTDKFGLSHSQTLAAGCYWAVLVLTMMAAFDRLDIKFELLNYAILIVLGGMALAFGLAVGFGGRDVVAGILAGYYLRQRMQSGDSVTIGLLEGTVREVGPVATIIETDEDGLMNRHSVPNTKMLHEAVR